MRDPLAIDAILVIFGGTLTVVSGAVLYANDGQVNVPAVLAGVVLTLACAAVVWSVRERLTAPLSRATEPTETPRQRARYVLPIVGLVLVRFLVLPLLPPVTLHGFVGAMATLVAIGTGRALYRGVGGTATRG